MDDMTEYEKWKNTPGRLGILASNGNFKRERRSEDETELFRAEFKERPRQIITKLIIGNPNSTEKVICNAIWDTGGGNACLVGSNCAKKQIGKSRISGISVMKTILEKL